MISFRLSKFYQYILSVFLGTLIFILWFALKSFLRGHGEFSIILNAMTGLVYTSLISLLTLFISIVRYEMNDNGLNDKRLFSRKRFITWSAITSIEIYKLGCLRFLIINAINRQTFYLPLILGNNIEFIRKLLKRQKACSMISRGD